MSIRVVKAESFHAVAISSIGRQAFRRSFAHLFNNKEELQEYLDYAYDPDKITRSIQKENNVFFLAFLENVPVGFAKVKKYSLNEQIESIAQMELQKIYVLPYYQGSGAGSTLMQEVLDLANETGPDYLWLNTVIGNSKAIRFYEKHGFKKTGWHYFRIGTQTFEYHLMSLPIAVMHPCMGN
jgi:ribosomal protein S18 acetylase RimI-like enzyme